MGDTTLVSYAHHTFSPWIGCEKVSGGCTNCFASATAARFGWRGLWGPGSSRRPLSLAYWRKPLAWDKAARKAGERRRVMVTLCDPFEDRRDLDEARARYFSLIEETPALDWLLCTKRVENVAGMVPWGSAWPSNVWMLATVEDQAAADARVPVLLALPAAVRGLSLEPLLGVVSLGLSLGVPMADGSRWFGSKPGIDWLIVGGESGPKARPCAVEWIRDLVRRGREAGVATFVKQLGACAVTMGEPTGNFRTHAGRRQYEIAASLVPGLHDPAGRNPDEWPEDLRVREFPRLRSLAWRRP